MAINKGAKESITVEGVTTVASMLVNFPMLCEKIARSGRQILAELLPNIHRHTTKQACLFVSSSNVCSTHTVVHEHTQKMYFDTMKRE